MRVPSIQWVRFKALLVDLIYKELEDHKKWWIFMSLLILSSPSSRYNHELWFSWPPCLWESGKHDSIYRKMHSIMTFTEFVGHTSCKNLMIMSSSGHNVICTKILGDKNTILALCGLPREADSGLSCGLINMYETLVSTQSHYKFWSLFRFVY